MTIESITSHINTDEVLLWQYNEASKLQAIIENRKVWLETNFGAFFDDFYVDVFDLQTANEFGLSIWAVLLGVSFSFPVPLPDTWFGFTGSGGVAFNQSAFYPITSQTLSVSQKRIVLQLRYFFLTTGSTLDEISAAIETVINDMLVLDTLEMALILTYPTALPGDIDYILNEYFDEIIPRPAGVSVSTRYNYSNWFGFTGSGGQNFNNGNFGG